LEADQTEAALGLARMVAQDSAGRADVARARLHAQFPELPLPLQAPDVPAPALAERELDAMRDEVIANSHEIAAAEAAANRLDRVALRHKKDERADPSAGVRLFTERGGEEKGVGLVVSWPLGGGHRKAVTAGTTSDATAAWADAAAVRRTVEEMADADRAEAAFRYSAWQKSRAMLDAQVAALLKVRRGYELGAIDLSDLLFAERQAHEAFRIEAAARCDAWRALTRFRIDAHRIWIGD
jgi:outer membrane protein, heavy metal efflux system